MIFVTVGTHEQPFNRLLECIDKLIEEGTIKEDVIIQSGYSTYRPKYCSYKSFFSYTEMIKNVMEARIVITHGGPSSFIMPLQYGKVPIIVPRKKEFFEHVNNHQIDFCKLLTSHMKSIIVVENIEKLEEVIKKYDDIVCHMNVETFNNNVKFNHELEKIAEELFNRKREKSKKKLFMR